MQVVTPANADNLPVVGRQPVTAAKEPTVLVAWFEVESMSRKEKEKASLSSMYLDLKPL